MIYGNTEIVTPDDNPVQFAPDWRNLFAIASLDYPRERVAPEYAHYRDDPWVRAQIQYLKAVRGGRQLTREQKAMRLASIWYQGNRPSDVKFKLEPLLLTPATFDTISLDIGGGDVDPEVFRAYERVYFNVRTDAGQMHRSCQLRSYFATPDGPPGPTTPSEVVWRAVGAHLGYDALASMWLWSDAHGLSGQGPEVILQDLWRVAQSTIFVDIYCRRMNHEDLGGMMSRLTEHERMRADTSRKDGQGTETLKAMLQMLALTKPDIISAAKEVDEEQALTASIQARIASQLNITQGAILDRGLEAGEDGLNKLIAGNFKPQKQE